MLCEQQSTSYTQDIHIGSKACRCSQYGGWGLVPIKTDVFPSAIANWVTIFISYLLVDWIVDGPSCLTSVEGFLRICWTFLQQVTEWLFPSRGCPSDHPLQSWSVVFYFVVYMHLRILMGSRLSQNWRHIYRVHRNKKSPTQLVWRSICW